MPNMDEIGIFFRNAVLQPKLPGLRCNRAAASASLARQIDALEPWPNMVLPEPATP